MKDKSNAIHLQDRVLALIDQHISILEGQIQDFVSGDPDDDGKKPKVPMYLSMDLNNYLKTLSGYIKSEEEGIGKQLKSLEKMSEEELQKMMDGMNEQGNQSRSLNSLSSAKKKK